MFPARRWEVGRIAPSIPSGVRIADRSLLNEAAGGDLRCGAGGVGVLPFTRRSHTIRASMTRQPASHVNGHGGAVDDWRTERASRLIPHRVDRILLVASPYDSFMLEEYGLLTELIHAEYVELGLTHTPEVEHVTTAEAALSRIGAAHFDLVISTMRLGDSDVNAFVRQVRQLDPILPVVLLVASEAELVRMGAQGYTPDVDSVYVWNGDSKLFLAIIKSLEDRWNVEHDTRIGGVGVIILIEDSRRFRSSLLPIMYAELVQQTRAVMADGINRLHKLLRMRARPKILVAETFEGGIEFFDKYKDHLFGVIADVSFPRGGVADGQAGIDFIRWVRAELPDLPALLQSSQPANRAKAEAIGASFLHKRSSTLLQDVRQFMLENFGFGDFVFRMPDGQEVARAADLVSITRALETVPPESLEYHAGRNHFSNWLRARTEFDLARELRSRSLSEFPEIEALRRYLIHAFREALRRNRRGVVEDFARDRFDESCQIARIGGGSLGGKARGLAFVDSILNQRGLDREFPDVRLFVPQSVVIGTNVFDEFLEHNRLRLLALRSEDARLIEWSFRTAELPPWLLDDLRAYLATVRQPIAVRSSSLFEDSAYYPLAGVYATHMIPNDDADDRLRLSQLCDAIRLVYASTYSPAARRYMETTPHRIEEEKMAVILQPVVGRRYKEYYYPHFAGVALSYNYYPFGDVRPDQGVASVALGLGATVVDGGDALRFCPAYPQVLPQLAYGREFIDRSQRRFYALKLDAPASDDDLRRGVPVVRLGLDEAEEHGSLAPVGSVWSDENNAFYDGIYRPGVRVVTFAHVLKSDLFPLAPILDRLLCLGRAAMCGPVEIEFAGNLDRGAREFAILQMRPVGSDTARGPVDLPRVERDEILCESPRAMGNGVFDALHDVVYVKPGKFDNGRTEQIAAEVASINATLLGQGRECFLIGPGRWGTSNRSLGVPVNWSQISSARVIVETSLENFVVDPSLGSHFFHNLTSLGIAYLTVHPRLEQGFIDWPWLESLEAAEETEFVRHVRLPNSIEAHVDGRISHAVVLKRARASTRVRLA